MEDHGAGCHPALLHGGQAAFAYGVWDATPLAAFDADGRGDQQPLDECFATASELREALLRALNELDAVRGAHQAELRRVESEAARLVASAAAERDELRRHCHSLLVLLHHHQTSPPLQSLPGPPLLHAVGVQGGGEGVCAMDEHVTVVSSNDQQEEDAELEMALARRLPEKGRLVEAVVSAGPLLQTLLLAGPLPRWRHPPPPAPADLVIPPFNPGRQADATNYSFSSASSSSPESNCSGGGVGPAPPVPAVQQQHHALPVPACFHMMGSSFCM
ncbi:uncharacterized protein [Lolium perenne]|uniref:uncharacterized protein n=1 Tax=Lolium perenne TaxID=4522 RepID=UPI0021EB0E67|nr:uncharacterized protein LOC127329588 [Lolium perenne]